MQMRFLGLAALLGAAGCYSQYTSPEYPASYGWNNQQAPVQGPPGGGMDNAEDDGSNDPQDPQNYGGPADGSAYTPGEPGAPGAYAPEQQAMPDEAAGVSEDTATAPVNDAEINATLDGYGSWVEDEEYGRVWRPNATTVGVDFTPYETCGSWAMTSFGWTYNCSWDWGWLPFHYGQWAYFDSWGGWGWCPGYQWSPGWVDWRDGGGYVGWRPSRPAVRDHRNGVRDIRVRDHRRNHGLDDSQWRFVKKDDLGRPNVRAHQMRNIAEGLRATTVVPRPTHAYTGPKVHATAVMSGRRGLGGRALPTGSYGPSPRPAVTTRPPAGSYQQPTRGTYQPRGGTYTPYQPGQPGRPATTGTYQPPARTGTYTPYQPPRGTYQPQQPSGTYQPPRGTYQPQQPSRTGSYQPPRGSYQPPSRPTGTYQPGRPATGTYQPPRSSGSYSGSRPATGTYQPPSRPSGSYSGSHSAPPSRGSYSAPSHAAPSRASSPSPSSSSGSRSSSSPSSSSSSGKSSSSSSSSSSSGKSSSSSSSSSSSGGSRSSSSSGHSGRR